MSSNCIILLTIIVGAGLAIVIPYVFVDFYYQKSQLSWSEWASWAQAIGSIFSVSVAAWTVFYQQNEMFRKEEKARNFKNMASRAALPPNLVKLSNYIEQCLDLLNEYKIHYDNEESKTNFIAPPFPHEVINPIKDCIESSIDIQRVRLSKLIEQLQIQHSRLEQINKRTNRISIITTKYTIACRIIDALDLEVRTNDLYPYARQENNIDPGEPNKGKMLKALSESRIDDQIDDDLTISQIITKQYT